MESTNTDATKRRILIQRVEDLPTLPTTLTKILEVAESEDASARDLAHVISQDQSISSMVLRIVNSAFYGHFRKISSISHATVIIGFQTVKSLALGASIFRATPATSESSFDRRRFWTHALGVGTFSKKIATLVSLPDDLDMETIFVSGLLHDLGKVVFDNYFNEEYSQVAREAMEKKELIRVMEAKMMGMDHTVAGKHLAKKWQFPAPVICSIEHHHSPAKAQGVYMVIASIVHLANYCCHEIGLGSSGNAADSLLERSALDISRLPVDVLDEVIESVSSERESIEAFGLE